MRADEPAASGDEDAHADRLAGLAR
jgi:hypothetical protein